MTDQQGTRSMDIVNRLSVDGTLESPEKSQVWSALYSLKNRN